jgi:hypothetical protein
MNSPAPKLIDPAANDVAKLPRERNRGADEAVDVENGDHFQDGRGGRLSLAGASGTTFIEQMPGKQHVARVYPNAP